MGNAFLPPVLRPWVIPLLILFPVWHALPGPVTTPGSEKELTSPVEGPVVPATSKSTGKSLDGDLSLYNLPIRPGEKNRYVLRFGEGALGAEIATPAIVVDGARGPGQTLCLTAGIHGDELNGVETVRQLMAALDPSRVRGRIVGLPIINMPGFRRGNRYLPDRRDLNRYFPGYPRGSFASRIAYRLFQQVIRYCDLLVDYHTGSFFRSNLPQVRADMTNEKVSDLARSFDTSVIIHSTGRRGTLRRAAVDAGVPAILFESGSPSFFQKDKIRAGVRGSFYLFNKLGFLTEPITARSIAKVYYQTRWVRVNDGGIMLNNSRLGQTVKPGDLLARVMDPFTNEMTPIIANQEGQIIGMAVSQLVMAGYAAFHIGLKGVRPRADHKDTTEPDDETPDGDGDGSGNGTSSREETTPESEEKRE